MKTVRKSTKSTKATSVNVDVHIQAAHAYIRISMECDKVLSKKTPKLMRQIADAIETGELQKWLDHQTGVSTIKVPTY